MALTTLREKQWERRRPCSLWRGLGVQSEGRIGWELQRPGKEEGEKAVRDGDGDTVEDERSPTAVTQGNRGGLGMHMVERRSINGMIARPNGENRSEFESTALSIAIRSRGASKLITYGKKAVWILHLLDLNVYASRRYHIAYLRSWVLARPLPGHIKVLDTTARTCETVESVARGKEVQKDRIGMHTSRSGQGTAGRRRDCGGRKEEAPRLRRVLHKRETSPSGLSWVYAPNAATDNEEFWQKKIQRFYVQDAPKYQKT
ncbi:hypothetical protein DFH06DRAFT_1399240 [Mycena polygramma]|nr:hypothetical protein DFH06DRAFT_1399240 [Mycena polygramma]